MKNNINIRKASIIHIGGFRPTGNPLASHFGLTPMALPGEEWPQFYGSQRLSSGETAPPRNLFFVCQLNLTEAPYVPDILSDIKLITIFVNPDFVDSEYFCIRAYRSLDRLVPILAPKEATFDRGFEVQYELSDDEPKYDDADLVMPDDMEASSKAYDDYLAKMDNRHCSKIGGYASSIQSSPFSYIDEAKPKFCLQIDTETKVGLMWGDTGTFYVARGTAPGYEDKWFVDCQFY